MASFLPYHTIRVKQVEKGEVWGLRHIRSELILL